MVGCMPLELLLSSLLALISKLWNGLLDALLKFCCWVMVVIGCILFVSICLLFVFYKPRRTSLEREDKFLLKRRPRRRNSVSQIIIMIAALNVFIVFQSRIPEWTSGSFSIISAIHREEFTLLVLFPI